MKIDHIQLAMPVDEEAKARAFFVELLQMEEERKPEPLASRGGCWFRKGDVIIHMGVEKEYIPQRKAHPAFIVEDLQGVADILEEKEYPVIWDDALLDRKRFYTSDPFGNRIEFIRDGDGFSQKPQVQQGGSRNAGQAAVRDL